MKGVHGAGEACPTLTGLIFLPLNLFLPDTLKRYVRLHDPKTIQPRAGASRRPPPHFLSPNLHSTLSSEHGRLHLGGLGVLLGPVRGTWPCLGGQMPGPHILQASPREGTQPSSSPRVPAMIPRYTSPPCPRGHLQSCFMSEAGEIY
jgi:hypothetical protein